MTKDSLFRGEFEVVKELLAAFPDGEASKRECDKVSRTYSHKSMICTIFESK